MTDEELKAVQFYDLMKRALKTTGVRYVVLSLDQNGEIFADAVTDNDES